MLANIVIVSLAAFGLVAVQPQPDAAQAWKPPTHLYGVEAALQDVIDDGVMEIPDIHGSTISVGAESTIIEALRKFPESYRAGTVGPDAFPDIYFGQSQIHPDTHAEDPTGDTAATWQWLEHLWEQAWRPRATHDERLRNISFALGYMAGHANGDVWSHTWVNEYAHGVFPSPSETEHAEVAVRHLVVEGYVDKHRPGYEDHQTYAIDAPTEFIAEALIFSDFARDHADHPLYDFFFDLKDGLVAQEADFAHDNATQDMLCGEVAGVEVCVPDPTDSPLNVIEWGFDLLIEAYLDAWIADIDRGLHDWVKVFETIANELMTGKKPDADVVMAAFKDWVLLDLLSMLGLPDFVGGAIYLVGVIIDFILTLITDLLRATFDALKATPVVGPFFVGVEGLYDKTSAEISGFIGGIVDDVAAIFLTLALGFTNLDPDAFDAIDRNDDGKISPMEVIRVIQEPEEYIEHPALFEPGTRAAIDAEMGLPPGVDDDDNDVFRDYDWEVFAPLRDTVVMSKIGMLNQHGLNELFRAVAGGPVTGLAPLYGNHPVHVPWFVPNNVMLGWAKSIDGEYQWRETSPHDGESYGRGTMPLFEDCVSRRRVFGMLFVPPSADIDALAAFGDIGDAPSGITDAAPPTHSVAYTGPTVVSAGKRYVSGTTDIAITTTDNYFPKAELLTFLRIYEQGATPPAYGPGTVPDVPAFQLTGADGARVVQYYGVDGVLDHGTPAVPDKRGCNQGVAQSEGLVLDNTPPTITVTSPASPQTDYLSDLFLPLTFTADDGPGSGVDAATAVHFADGVQVAGPPGQVDLFDYPAGIHTYEARQADLLGNLGVDEVTWRTVVSHTSLQSNLRKAFAERRCIRDEQTHRALDVQLRNAEASDLRGNDGASDNQLEAFKNEVARRTGELSQPGAAVTPYCANVLITNATALQEA
jgi:hypothetical protein